MDRLKQKHKQLLQALSSLEKSIINPNKLEQRQMLLTQGIDIDREEEYRVYRDSLIQRFEYSIDLFWKYIKKYLEYAHLLNALKVPSDVIREAFSVRLISEEEAENILAMIKSRNMTSHI